MHHLYYLIPCISNLANHRKLFWQKRKVVCLCSRVHVLVIWWWWIISSAAVKCPSHLWMLCFVVGGIFNNIEFLFWFFCCGRLWNMNFVSLPLIQASNTSFQFLLAVIVHVHQSEDIRDCSVYFTLLVQDWATQLALDCCQLSVCLWGDPAPSWTFGETAGPL